MAKGAHSEKQVAAARKLGRASGYCKVKKVAGVRGSFNQCIRAYYQKYPGSAPNDVSGSGGE